MIQGQTIKNTYNGDGTTRVFNITFEFEDVSQIKFKVNSMPVDTNFSINAAAKTLTYPTVESELDPLTSADEIEIYRDTGITQDIDFENGGLLNAEMIEKGLDKLTMIAQELKKAIVPKESNLIVLPAGTDIDTVLQEGEYWIPSATCGVGFPSDVIKNGEIANTAPAEAIFAYIRVIKTKTENWLPTVKATQLCLFYTKQSGSGTVGFSCAYIRTTCSETSSGYWTARNIINDKKAVGCGVFFGSSSVYIPSTVYPNTAYFLGNFIKEGNYNTGTIYTLTSLTLPTIPDSPYPIEFIFKTGNSFSGITASDIKAWIGSTTLDTNSAYKITITNLIGKIEKLTLVE